MICKLYTFQKLQLLPIGLLLADLNKYLVSAGETPADRRKLKVNAAIENAITILLLQQEFGSFEKWLVFHHPKTKTEWIKLFKRLLSLLEEKL